MKIFLNEFTCQDEGHLNERYKFNCNVSSCLIFTGFHWAQLIELGFITTFYVNLDLLWDLAPCTNYVEYIPAVPMKICSTCEEDHQYS